MFTDEERENLKVINDLFDKAEDVLLTMSEETRDKIRDFHHENYSLAHCVRWGLLGSQELLDKDDLVTYLYVDLSGFTQVETSRGTLSLPTIAEEKDNRLKKEISYNVCENHGEVRIYINGLGKGEGYIEILEDGSIKTTQKAWRAIEMRMQTAIGMAAEEMKKLDTLG